MIKKKILMQVATIFMALCLLTEARATAINNSRSIETYTVPDVVLVNQDGQKIRLKSFVETDQPVFLEFIFTTCTTICPVLSAGFANLQRRLGPDFRKARLVSISIDPEHDTPNVMKEYLKRFQAKPGWNFLTGTREDIDRVMKAFDAYVSDKMTHYQLTLVRSPLNGKWTRIMGLVSYKDLLAEYKKASKK